VHAELGVRKPGTAAQPTSAASPARIFLSKLESPQDDLALSWECSREQLAGLSFSPDGRYLLFEANRPQRN